MLTAKRRALAGSPRPGGQLRRAAFQSPLPPLPSARYAMPVTGLLLCLQRQRRSASAPRPRSGRAKAAAAGTGELEQLLREDVLSRAERIAVRG